MLLGTARSPALLRFQLFADAQWPPVRAGLLAPAGTPKDITLRMQREIEKIVQQPDIQERLSASGAEPIASTPEQFGAYLSSEVVKWARVVKQAKIPQIQQ